MGTAPVDDLVLEVGDRREGDRPPAEDAVGDLEPPPDDPARRPPGPVLDRVAGERLADRNDVTDGQPGRPNAVVVAPRVAQVGDDDVAGRPATRQVDRRRRIDEDPAWSRRARAELEGQAVEDLPPGRETGQGPRVGGVESGGDLGLGRVP